MNTSIRTAMLLAGSTACVSAAVVGIGFTPATQLLAQAPIPAVSAGIEGGEQGTNIAAAADARPLPDIPALMREVEANQRTSEAMQKDYLYRSVVREDELDGSGRLKKSFVEEYDHYWVNGVPIRRLVKKDGRELTAEELAKENERVDKEAAKARERREKRDAQGRESDAQGHDEITVSRFLAVGAFSNPRRVLLNRRDTIVVDYAGDPRAKTQNRAEDAVRQMAGTVWVDEQDRVLARVEGRFVNAYKVGGGLVVDVKKDTHFTFEQRKVNGEVWLPAKLQAQGAARAMLFFSFSGAVNVADSDYRKFRTSARIVPGAGDGSPEAGEAAPSPKP